MPEAAPHPSSPSRPSAASVPENPPCPKCRSGNTRRLRRESVIERAVYPMLGFYPWSCQSCQRRFTLRNRGRLKRKRSREGEAHLPPIG